LFTKNFFYRIFNISTILCDNELITRGLTEYTSYLIGFMKIRILLKLLPHDIADLHKVATHQVYSSIRQSAL